VHLHGIAEVIGNAYTLYPTMVWGTEYLVVRVATNYSHEGEEKWGSKLSGELGVEPVALQGGWVSFWMSKA